MTRTQSMVSSYATIFSLLATLVTATSTLNDTFVLTSSPSVIKNGLTENVTLECATIPYAIPYVAQCACIQIMKRGENTDWTLFAEFRDDETIVQADSKTLGADSIKVVGRNDTFADLKVLWTVASDDTFGEYRCDVNWFDKNMEPVFETTPVVTIKEQSISAWDVMQLLQKQLRVERELEREKWEEKLMDFTREQVSERMVGIQGKNEQVDRKLKELKEDMVSAREQLDQNGWNQFKEEVESFLQEANNSFSNIKSDLNSTKTRQDELMQSMEVLKEERNETNVNSFQTLKNTEIQQNQFTQSLQILETNLHIQMNISTSINNTLNDLIDSLRPKWPPGMYGLLQTENRCPGGMGWKYGYVQIHTESSERNVNSVSGAPHMNLDTSLLIGGNYFMKLSICVIAEPHAGNAWPAGSYCIMRCGGTCPSGFDSGYIRIDTEDNNNKNTRGGFYTDVIGSGIIDLNFCCRSDSSSSTPIVLPTEYPFYLFRYLGSCQNVMGMTVREEYFIIDSENDRNADKYENIYHPDGTLNNVKLELCYYS